MSDLDAEKEYEIFAIGPKLGWQKICDSTSKDHAKNILRTEEGIADFIVAVPAEDSGKKAIVCDRRRDGAKMTYLTNDDRDIDRFVDRQRLPENSYPKRYAFVPTDLILRKSSRVKDRIERGARILIKRPVWNGTGRRISFGHYEHFEAKIVEFFGTESLRVKRIDTGKEIAMRLTPNVDVAVICGAKETI